MTRATLLLLLAIGCADSSLTTSGTLDVTGITPDHVSARGGMKVVVSGRGLSGVGTLKVRGIAVAGLESTEETVTFVMPSIPAGPAPMTLVAGGAETTTVHRRNGGAEMHRAGEEFMKGRRS